MRCCRPHFWFASAKVRTFGTHTKFLAKKFWRNFSGISLKTGVTRWMPARCGVQKKSRNFALSGGGHDRLCPLVGKSADLPAGRRAGKFARYALADVQMCKCAGMQISRRRGTRGMLLYIRIRAHAHARTSCILRRYCVHSALTKRFCLIINAFRCVGR